MNYTVGELANLLGLHRTRIRKAFKRVLASRGMDVKKFVIKQQRLAKFYGVNPRKIHPKRGTTVIPQRYVKELVEQLAVWEWKFRRENVDITKLYERSVVKGKGWGVLIFYDSRKRKVPVAWVINGEKVFIGLMKAVSGDFYKKLEEYMQNVTA